MHAAVAVDNANHPAQHECKQCDNSVVSIHYCIEYIYMKRLQ